ncbi:MAG: hypothetical protein AAGH48_03885 [Pseudomonadota bacterium]
MKKRVVGFFGAVIMAGPAMASEFMDACKADALAAGYGDGATVCACLETNGEGAGVLDELIEALEIKDIDERRASLSLEAGAAVESCAG